MWDCRFRTIKDFCLRRKTPCYPGGIGCVLKGKFEFPFRTDKDPLEKKAVIKKKKRAA